MNIKHKKKIPTPRPPMITESAGHPSEFTKSNFPGAETTDSTTTALSSTKQAISEVKHAMAKLSVEMERPVINLKNIKKHYKFHFFFFRT